MVRLSFLLGLDVYILFALEKQSPHTFLQRSRTGESKAGSLHLISNLKITEQQQPTEQNRLQESISSLGAAAKSGRPSTREYGREQEEGEGDWCEQTLLTR